MSLKIGPRVVFVALTWLALVQGVASQSPPSAQWERTLPEAETVRVMEIAERIQQFDREGRYGEAAELAGAVADIRREHQGVDHWGTIDAEWQQKLFAGDAALTEPERRQASEGWRLSSESYQLTREGRPSEAADAMKESLRIREALRGELHPDVAFGCSQVATSLAQAARTKEAVAYARRALELSRRLYGDRHPKVADCLETLAGQLRNDGRSAESLPLTRERVALALDISGPRHAAYADALGAHAQHLAETGATEQADAHFRQAFDVLRALPEYHPDVSGVLHNNYALFLVNRGRHGEAIELYRAACDDARQTGVPPVVPLVNLADLYRAVGDYGAAESCLAEATELAGQHGLPHQRYVLLEQRSRIRAELGQFTEAARLCRQALVACREMHGDDHPDIASIQGTLASIVRRQGDYGQASMLLFDALERLREHPEGPRRGVSLLIELAMTYTLLYLDDEAEPLLQEALLLCEQLRLDPAMASSALFVFSTIRARQGRYDVAEEMLVEALGYARLRGDVHIEAGIMLRHLGITRDRLGKSDAADADLREALRIIEQQSAGERHPEYVTTLFELAAVSRHRGRSEEAEGLCRRALKLTEHQMRADGHDEQARAFLTTQTGLGFGTRLLTIILAERGELAEALAVSEQARSRALQALLARADFDAVAVARKSGDEAAVTRLETRLETERRARAEYTLKRAEYLALFGTGNLDHLSDAEHARLTESLAPALRLATEHLEAAEAALAEELRDLWPEARPVPIRQALDALAPGEVLLSYTWSGEAVVLFAASRDTADPACPVVRSMVIAADRKEAEALRRQANTVRERMATRPRSSAAPADAEWRAFGERIIPAEARALMDGARRVVIVPDEALHEIALEPFIMAPDAPPIVYASSVAMFANRREARGEQAAALGEAGPRSALVLADPLFGSEGADPGIVGQPDFGDALKPLPGTRLEAQGLARLFGDRCLVLDRERATVTQLREHAPGRRYLHLATHGFAGNVVRPYNAFLVMTQPDDPTPTDDGFLTLDDMIREWRGELRDCELAVLSACNTRRGASTKDGVMALPWGFYFAGVPTVVASLWQADDAATALLMTRFYENMLGVFESERAGYAPGTPMPKDRALHDAKVWLKELEHADSIRLLQRLESPEANVTRDPRASTEGGRSYRPFSHPFYWAGFVLSGSPD